MKKVENIIKDILQLSVQDARNEISEFIKNSLVETKGKHWFGYQWHNECPKNMVEKSHSEDFKSFETHTKEFYMAHAHEKFGASHYMYVPEDWAQLKLWYAPITGFKVHGPRGPEQICLGQHFGMCRAEQIKIGSFSSSDRLLGITPSYADNAKELLEKINGAIVEYSRTNMSYPSSKEQFDNWVDSGGVEYFMLQLQRIIGLKREIKVVFN